MHTKPCSGHTQGVLILNVIKVFVNTSEVGAANRRLTSMKKKEGKYKVGMMCQLEGGCLLYGSHT